MSDSQKLLRAIRMKRKPQHDTLYCNEYCKKLILNTISGHGKSFRTSDNVSVAGLDVETHERFTTPITCEKGQLFPLTEDYKE